MNTYLSSLSLLALKSLVRDLASHLLGADTEANYEESGHWMSIALNFGPDCIFWIRTSYFASTGLVIGNSLSLKFALKALGSSSTAAPT
jgi:hypothetical protein